METIDSPLSRQSIAATIQKRIFHGAESFEQDEHKRLVEQLNQVSKRLKTTSQEIILNMQ